MVKFQVIQPSKLLKPYVKQYWFLSIDNAGDSSQRYIPSGCAALVFHRGERIYSTLHQELQPYATLCGQSLLYTDTIYSGNIDFIMVVFQPIAAREIFGIPMNELQGKNVDIESLGDTSLSDLKNRLQETEDNYQCINYIDNYLLNKLCDFASDKFDRMNAVVQSINNGQNDITELSLTTCLGYKQFKRVFAEYAGLNPKEFLQIARFRKALYGFQVHSQIKLSHLASDYGYCDKSHLIKEFRTFTGYTPKEYLSISDPYSDYLSLFNSFFINGESNSKYKRL